MTKEKNNTAAERKSDIAAKRRIKNEFNYTEIDQA